MNQTHRQHLALSVTNPVSGGWKCTHVRKASAHLESSDPRAQMPRTKCRLRTLSQVAAPPCDCLLSLTCSNQDRFAKDYLWMKIIIGYCLSLGYHSDTDCRLAGCSHSNCFPHSLGGCEISVVGSRGRTVLSLHRLGGTDRKHSVFT